MSHTTHVPSGLVLGKNVRLHPKGRSLEVRVHPFPPRAGFTIDQAGVDASNTWAAKLRRLKAEGVLELPSVEEPTLREVAEQHLARLERVGGRRKRPYCESGMKAARRDARPWLGESAPVRFVKGGSMIAPAAVDEHGVPFGSLLLKNLRVAPVEQYLELRSMETHRAAVGECQMLMAIVKTADRRGYELDPRLLVIDPLLRRKTVRPRLTDEQVLYLAACAPEHVARWFLIGRTLGSRVSELTDAEDAWLDFDAGGVGVLTIPDWATKEKREKTLDLLAEEALLFREQQLVRSPATATGQYGTKLLFPRQGGSPWGKNFWNDVVFPVRRKAAKKYRDEQGLFPDADTPFEWVVRDGGRPVMEPLTGEPRIRGWQPHDLRRTASDLLKEMGIPSRLIAARFGHADQGELIDSTYAEDRRRQELRAEVAAIAAEGGIEARLARVRTAGGR